MNRVIIAICVVAGFLVMGCPRAEAKKVEVYTFKKARVDQEIKGNRGYVTGEVPEAPVKERKAERTLIGVDIELPGRLFFGKGAEAEAEARPEEPAALPVEKKEEAVTAEEKTEAVEKIEIIEIEEDVEIEGEEVREDIKVRETEEEWIK